MSNVGRLMVQSGVITEDQLTEAIRAMAVYGGRIGTNLVELGYVNENTLQAFLALHHGVSPMAHDAKPSSEALACLPPEACDQLNVLPLQIEGQTLVVATVDPSDTELLMQAQRKANRPVRAVVAPEGRLFALMRDSLGIQRPLRYAVVEAEAERVSEGDIGRVPLRSILQDQAFTEPTDEDIDLSEFEAILLSQVIEDDEFSGNTLELDIVVDTGAGDEPAWEDHGFDIRTADINFSPATAPQADAAVLAAHQDLADDSRPISFQDAVVAIEDCVNRDQLASAVLRYALWHYRRAILFTVQRGFALGWEGLGDKLDQATVHKLMIPLNAPSNFRQVYESRQPHQGTLSNAPLMTLFVKIIGGDWPEACQLVPFVVGDKVVGVLYADGELGERTPARSSEFSILSTQVSRAFGRFIAQLDLIAV